MPLDHSRSLVVADESSAGPFVVGGILHLPATAVAKAIRTITAIKQARGVPLLAKIHCRELFAGSARLKSPFKHLSVEDCHTLLAECVEAMLTENGQWFGCYIDADAYPKELRLVQGATFSVSRKHLAGLAMFSAVVITGQKLDEQFQLAFDADPTKVDWGLTKRTQATHFARIDDRTVTLAPNERSLLDMADIAAYTLTQSLLCRRSPLDRKPWHLPFPKLLERMRMQNAEFFYDPERSP